MGDALRIQGRLTFEEYLALEERTGVRHEFVGGFAYPMDQEEENMVGASVNHCRIVRNLEAALHRFLLPPCEVFSESLKLKFEDREGDDVTYYPDVMVCCDPDDSDTRWRRRPTFIAEVASPSTERNDRSEKLHAYFSISSVREYWVISQDRRLIHVYEAASDFPIRTISEGDTPRIACLDFSTTMDALYSRVSFQE